MLLNQGSKCDWYTFEYSLWHTAYLSIGSTLNLEVTISQHHRHILPTNQQYWHWLHQGYWDIDRGIYQHHWESGRCPCAEWSGVQRVTSRWSSKTIWLIWKQHMDGSWIRMLLESTRLARHSVTVWKGQCRNGSSGEPNRDHCSTLLRNVPNFNNPPW